jgi:hypothetical protein
MLKSSKDEDGFVGEGSKPGVVIYLFIYFFP